MKKCAGILSILLLPFLPAAFAQAPFTQLIQNGNFGAGFASWPSQGSAGYGVQNGYLYMGNANGASQYVYQTITFPTNLIGATLNFNVDISTTDSTGYDSLTVYIADSSFNVITNLSPTPYSNFDPTSGWVGILDDLTGYSGNNIPPYFAGKTVNLVFHAMTDPFAGSNTVFYITDVSVLAGTPANIPPNDNFANAAVIPTNGITTNVNTMCASKETGEPVIAGNNGGHSVWWTWTAPVIGTANISTVGSGIETLLGVYTGSSLNNLTLVATNNGHVTGTGWASVKFNTTPGAQYQIALDGYNGEFGPADFKFSFSQDKTPPTVAISSAVVTNSSLLVKGVAHDNVAVSLVQYKLENASGPGFWANAMSTNGWTNWSATVTNLIPGTNTVVVQSIDTSGNLSLLATRLVDYIITAKLTLSTNGQGTISGATNGQKLDINFPYKITALAKPGFRFTNWTGNITNNSAILSFIMSSNSSFTANFVDDQKPSLSITVPTIGERWSNSLFQITGKAADNVAVAQVWYQLDAGSWTLASTNINWSNWYANVTLTQPTNNTVRAYAVDTTGNLSITDSVNFVYIPSARLHLAANGPGTMLPNYSNALLQLGNRITITATARTGYVFSNWLDSTGAIYTNNPKLTFIMQSNLTFTANFIPNPFLGAAGMYQGLFFNSNDVTSAGSGFVSATLENNGTFSANLQQGNTPHAISGQLSLTGEWSTNGIKAWSNTAVSLSFDLMGGQTLTGSLSNAIWTATLNASRPNFSATTNKAPQAGKYTIVIPGTNSAAYPGGDGFGTVTVSTAGVVTFLGTLGDGTTVSQTAAITPQGEWPLYVSLYGGNGMLLGWMTFTNVPDWSFEGQVQWFKPSHPLTTLYAAGFTNAIEATGSAYAFTNGMRVLELTNGYVLLEDGNLSQSISNQFVMSANNLVTGFDKLSLTFTTSSGLFSGSATNAAGKIVLFKGAILQNQNAGFGQFLGTNESSGVYLAPR